MKIFRDFTQKSPEWWRIRRGLPTASEFHRIIQPVKMGPSTSQDPFIDELIAELVDQTYSEQPDDGYVSESMANGTAREGSARLWYAFDRDIEVEEVGFCLSDCGRFGCSPDGLIGMDGGLEIKAPDLKTHVRYLRNGGLPSEYKCQVHGELLTTERDWFDFISFSPSEELPHLVVRVTPDEFTKALKSEL